MDPTMELEALAEEFADHKCRVFGKLSTLQYLLERRYEDHKLQTEALEHDLEQKKAECLRLQNYLASRKDKSIRLEREKDQLEGQVSELESKMAEAPKFTDDVLSLQAEKISLMGEKKTLMVENSNLREQVRVLKDNAKSNKVQLHMAKRDNEALNKLLEEAERARSLSTLEIDRLENCLTSACMEHARLTHDAQCREARFRLCLERLGYERSREVPKPQGSI